MQLPHLWGEVARQKPQDPPFLPRADPESVHPHHQPHSGRHRKRPNAQPLAKRRGKRSSSGRTDRHLPVEGGTGLGLGLRWMGLWVHWLGDPGQGRTPASPIPGLVSQRGPHRPGVELGEGGACVFLTGGEIHQPRCYLSPASTPGSSVPLLPSSLELGPQVRGTAEVSWKCSVDSVLPQTASVALSQPGSQARLPLHFITCPHK